MILDLRNLSASETKRLNKLSSELMKSYTDFVDEYSGQYGDNYLFWATPFASRNIFLDDSFLHLCKVRLAVDLVKEDLVDEIITCTRAEYETLKGAIGNCVKVSLLEKWSLRAYIKRAIVRFAKLMRFCKDKIMYILLTRNVYRDYPEKMSIVSDFTVSSNFKDYVYTDKYMPGIADYHPNVYFLPIIVYNDKTHNRGLVDQIVNCKSHKFIVGNGLLKVSDLSEVVKYIHFVCRMMRGVYYFEGIDVSEIIRDVLHSGISNRSSLEGLMLRKMIQRMPSKGIIPDNFILWYEGQPADILISSTVRTSFPNVNIVGYLGTPPEEKLMSLYISDYQFHSGHSPMTMTVPGCAYKKMAHQFCPDIPVMTVPILRNEYRIQKSFRTGGTRNLLVLLPIFRDVSRAEIVMVERFVNKNAGYHVMIKNHPVNKDCNIKDYGINYLSFEPEFVGGILGDSLKRADVVLSSLTTSSMEVLFAQVPLVILCPPGELCFSALPIELSGKLCHMVYGYDEMEDALKECFNNPGIDMNLLKDLLVPKKSEYIEQMFTN